MLNKKSTHPTDRANRCVVVGTHLGSREGEPNAGKTGRVGMRAGGQKGLDTDAQLGAAAGLDLTQDGLHSDRLLGQGLIPQNGPGDIGAQVFAADQAVGGLLDLRAALGGDLALALRPTRHIRGKGADSFTQAKLGTAPLAFKVGLEIHARYFSLKLNTIQAKSYFYFLAISYTIRL